MKVILKPFTEDTKGYRLMSNIYKVCLEKENTVIIKNETINGIKLHEVNKNRILKVIEN